MKGKFKILGHIGLVLFVVSALMLTLIPVAPVAAATAVTNVWVQFTESSYNVNSESTATATGFTFHFTPTTAMKRGVDTITVWFPDGSTDMGPAAFTLASASTSATYYVVDRDGEVVTYSATDCTDDAVLSTSGYRITVKTPVDLSAGVPCSLKIEAAAAVKTSVSSSRLAYKIKVYTSKDTTPVASDSFYLDDTGPASVSLDLSPDTAGSAGQYTFTVSLLGKTALTAAAQDTLTFIFPYGTTVPSSIAADKISFSTDNGSSWSTGTTDATVNQKARTVTVTTPITLDADANNKVRFSTGANILNLTTVGNDAYTDCYAFTSQDQLQVAESSGYNVTAGTATKLAFNNDAYPASSYSDSATMINMYSDVLYVELEDQYGNLKHISGTEPTVSFSSSSGTGAFYESGPTQITTKLLVDGKASIYYRDSTAGTATLTASATGYTSGTWTMTVVPGVGLYDSNNNLIKTYAPTSTSPATEGTTVHSGDYIQSAIDAAVTGDTVKLGDGTYELDAYITLNKKITLTSVNGASSTTIRPASEPLNSQWQTSADMAIVVGVTGTATNPVIIDGLTFNRLRYGTEFDVAIYNNGYNYVTVRNCVFNYIIPTEVSDNEWGSVVNCMVYAPETGGGDANITSGTISNNTFNNCGSFGFTSYGEQGANISVMSKGGGTAYTITGVTVSGNTLTDCNGIGIWLKGYSSSQTVTASVTDNTVTNAVYPLSICGYTSSCSILRNTITGGYMQGIWVEDDDHDSLVVKNNTITGCAAVGCSGWGSYSAAILINHDAGASGTDPVIQYNAIYNNDATYSIYVADTSIGNQDCKYNWFGDATGPYYSALTGASIAKSNTGGAGKKVSDYVTYYPWLHKSLTDVVTDNVSYQASNMRLVSGWNTLSTPVKLISTADAIDELIPSGMTIGYYYDATGWHQITTGYVLNPCDAVYVKMSAATDVLFKFDAGAFTNPSKSLTAGWNLIGLASLSSSGMEPDDAVASVYKTAANLPGYSQVVSPSLNATRYSMYYNTGASWSISSAEHGTTISNKNMFAGLGYWVYMQNAATLAGFEITPIAPDLD